MNIKYSFYFAIIISFFACKKETQEEVENTCSSIQEVNPVGNLLYNSSTNTYTYKIGNGINIIISNYQSIKITNDSIAGFHLDFWGSAMDSINNIERMDASHENLNGKHIKDRLSTVRTLILPDSTKLTFYTAVDSFYYSPLLSLSIYHKNECHRFNLKCNKLIYSMDTSLSVSNSIDSLEIDGEAGTIEFKADSILFVNIYNETIPNNKIFNRVPLGVTFKSNLANVNDLFDDTRLGHTFQPILNPKKDE